MNVGYIDSSFLLSIIFEDNNYDKSIEIWNRLDVTLGSVLLEIECMINLYKYFILHLDDKKLYREKNTELKGLISSINRKAIDEEIVLEIQNHDKLKRLKSLDYAEPVCQDIF